MLNLRPLKDDIIDDVGSFVAAAETLKERGAYKVFVMATHGILSSDAPRFIEESAIDEVRAITFVTGIAITDKGRPPFISLGVPPQSFMVED